MKDRQHLLTVHKKAKKLGFDVAKYNLLKEEIRIREKGLKKLKDSLQLHQTSQVKSTTKADETKPPMEGDTPKTKVAV